MITNESDDKPCWFAGHKLVSVGRDERTISVTDLQSGEYVTAEVRSYPYVTAACIARALERRNL